MPPIYADQARSASDWSIGEIMAAPGTIAHPSPMTRHLPALTLLVAAVTACATSSPPAATVAAPSTTRPQPKEIRFVRASAEYRAITLEVYRAAGDRLPQLSRGLAAGTWGVIMDADETLLDNSEYQRRRAAVDSGYSSATFAIWARERAAPPVPGAVEFTRAVHDLGGRVVVVSNRADAICDVTRENIQAIALAVDAVLCQTGTESDKNPRFRAVQSGTATPGLRALTVVAWVGDNILDFPSMAQTARDDPAALADFGRRYFLIPNPMYGSWERLPER